MDRDPGRGRAAERGYSLISVVIAVALAGLITASIMTAIYQIYHSSAASTNHLVAIREVQTAGRWIVRDARGAMEIEPAGDADGFPLSLRWNGPEGTAYETVYDITPDREIYRLHYTDRHLNPDPDITTLVGRYISPAETACSLSVDNELIVTITAVVEIDAGARSESRQYRIFPRPSLF